MLQNLVISLGIVVSGLDINVLYILGEFLSLCGVLMVGTSVIETYLDSLTSKADFVTRLIAIIVCHMLFTGFFLAVVILGKQCPFHIRELCKGHLYLFSMVYENYIRNLTLKRLVINLSIRWFLYGLYNFTGLTFYQLFALGLFFYVFAVSIYLYKYGVGKIIQLLFMDNIYKLYFITYVLLGSCVMYTLFFTPINIYIYISGMGSLDSGIFNITGDYSSSGTSGGPSGGSSGGNGGANQPNSLDAGLYNSSDNPYNNLDDTRIVQWSSN